MSRDTVTLHVPIMGFHDVADLNTENYSYLLKIFCGDCQDTIGDVCSHNVMDENTNKWCGCLPSLSQNVNGRSHANFGH